MADKHEVNDVVVLLPGILGSVLERDGAEVWAFSRGAIWRGLTTLGRSVKGLELQDDHPEKPMLADGVQATRLMPDIHLLPGFWKIDGYGAIKQQLFEQFDFTDGLNWHDFPYDWRRDNRAAAHRLAERAPEWLDKHKQVTGKDAKLVLLGHSMGGLVSRYFLEALGGWEVTRALITFGTPYRGSINALDFLANGFRKGLGPFKLDLSAMLRSLTSVHQLLPIYPCVDDGSGALRRIGEATGLPGGVDQQRVAEARQFHDDITAGVDRNGGYGRYQIVPVAGIFQKTRQSAIVRNGEVQIDYLLDGDDVGGDGTVPRPSATPIELSDAAREVYATETHSSLQNHDPVVVQIAGVLTWKSLALYKAAPSDGFRIEVEEVVPPAEAVEVVLATGGPVRNVSVTAEDVDTGSTVSATAQIGSDGRAVVRLPGLAPGVYRLTGRDDDGVGLKPVHELLVVGDEAAATRVAEETEPVVRARGSSPAGHDATEVHDMDEQATTTTGTVDGTDPNLEPVQPPDHDCPDGDEGVIEKGTPRADSRGWGPGWPTDNSSKMAVVRAGGVAMSVRREIAPIVEWLLAETARRGYVMHREQCGGFNNRAIGDTKIPSNHSWGLAVDINWLLNPMTNRLVTNMPDWMPALWKSKGFRWGGDWKGKVDAMHYEYMGTPADAAREVAALGGAPIVPGAAGETRPRLKKGAKGEAVQLLQQRLVANGHALKVDGVFGAKTDAAVRAFQQGKGLAVDGVVGPKTWAALG